MQLLPYFFITYKLKLGSQFTNKISCIVQRLQYVNNIDQCSEPGIQSMVYKLLDRNTTLSADKQAQKWLAMKPVLLKILSEGRWQHRNTNTLQASTANTGRFFDSLCHQFKGSPSGFKSGKSKYLDTSFWTTSQGNLDSLSSLLSGTILFRITPSPLFSLLVH